MGLTSFPSLDGIPLRETDISPRRPFVARRGLVDAVLRPTMALAGSTYDVAGAALVLVGAVAVVRVSQRWVGHSDLTADQRIPLPESCFLAT